MKYFVKPVVCDYGIFWIDGGKQELIDICNVKSNAEMVAEILNTDNNHEVWSRPQGEWIPVSEKLPNICGVYNVTKRVIEGGRRYYIADSCYFDGTGTWHNDNRINFGREPVNCIIAWQPLPKPYKKEAENDIR